MTAYAWSEIRTAKDGKTKTIAWGDSVSAADVGGSDELDTLKAEGVVRDYAPPKDWLESGNYQNVSIQRHLIDKARAAEDAAAEGAMTGGSVAAPPLEEVLMGVGAGKGLRAAYEDGVSATPTSADAAEVDTMKTRIAELESESGKFQSTYDTVKANQTEAEKKAAEAAQERDAAQKELADTQKKLADAEKALAEANKK